MEARHRRSGLGRRPATRQILGGRRPVQAIEAVAQLATIVAYYHRIRMDKDLVPPDPDLRHAANFLYMLTGKARRQPPRRRSTAPSCCTPTTTSTPAPSRARHRGHLGGLPCRRHLAIGALKGPLHGGANVEVMKVLLEIDAQPRVARRLDRAPAARKRKIPVRPPRLQDHRPARHPPRQLSKPW